MKNNLKRYRDFIKETYNHKYSLGKIATNKKDKTYHCENCNNSKQITETTILYQINMEDKMVQVRSLEENELTTKDPLLPHTHDYTCKNPSCITHKKPELKDSVFLRESGTYKLTYICCVCYFSW
jgi:hypothetical protein